MHGAMALHPVHLWPKARRKAREWGRSSRHGRKLVKVAHQIAKRYCRVDHNDEDDDDETSSSVSSNSSISSSGGGVHEIETQEEEEQIDSQQGLATSVFFKLLLLGCLLLCLRHLYQLLVIGGILVVDVAVVVGSKLVERSSWMSSRRNNEYCVERRSGDRDRGSMAVALLVLVLSSLAVCGMVPATLATTAACFVLAKLSRSLAPPDVVVVSRR